MRARLYGTIVGVAATAAIFAVVLAVTGGSSTRPHIYKAKLAAGDPDAARATPGEGPIGGWDAYLAAARAYPANQIPPTVADRAEVAFDAIAAADAKRGDPKGKGHKWQQVGPKENANQPGVTSFSGATNNTASRTTALVVDPDCGTRHFGPACKVWIGAAGGGIWSTDNALADTPEWKQLNPEDLDQNSVGVLTLDPTDPGHDTLYLGTGEPNRCSSGCEAGVGVYKSDDGGNHWTKLDDTCVSNPTYACTNPGKDAFLGRGIRAVLVDPNNKNHLYVGSAQAVRGLSHVIGNGGTTRLEPGANAPGLYESTDGGKTFTMVWNGAAAGSFGITDVELDPLNPNTVYAAAFDKGLWRRDAGAAAAAFNLVFAPQFPGGGTDRVMIAPTVKNGQTRIYLTEGTANAGGIAGATAANFWRLDNANQSASDLLKSQAAGATPPDPATHTFPATYNGWQNLTSKTTGNPYFATDDFCTGQCWYDQNVYTPAGLPDTVYVIGSNQYGEQPCNTNGVGCGNGRSNGREVLYSNTAGDPDGAGTGAASLRTFTDLSYDATINHPPWCAYAPYFDNGCTNAPNGIHPDQHVIAVVPGKPTQILEGSDGGMIRTSGAFADISSQCDEPHRNGGGPLPSTTGSYTACKRLLSRVPTLLEHIDKKYGSTIQFINVAINPASDCEVMGGTQDNGTWSNLNDCDNKTWTQVIYGDGGNAGYDATNATWRFNEFTSGFSDSNFRNGDPEKWVITSAPVVNSGEGPAFYYPQIADPNPVPGSHPIYSGAKHVWRTWAFGGGHPGAVPQDKNPDVAYYEATCPEFVVSGANPLCGDYRPLGSQYCDGIHPPVTDPPTPDPIPDCTNLPGDLTGTAFGPASDRGGGSLSWLARDKADHGTLWAATSAGRIFVTHNADAADPANVKWHRIDSSTSGGSPTRFPSGIYVDPADTGHAWISYSGYNAVTPATQGHVFEVREGNPAVAGSGTFTNLNVESGTSAYPTPFSDGDLPVSDVVRDDASKTLYVSTDFGVLRGDDDGTGGWHVTEGMPRYEVMHLEMQPSSRVATCTPHKKCKAVLYAATHSQGIWQMKIDG
jgi:hypothetical protein